MVFIKGMKLLLAFLLVALSCLSISAKTKVATLSPLMADLARQIGGDKVIVVDLIGSHGNPHTFSPTSKVLQKAAGARLYLASGKNLEPYLPKLKSLISNHSEVLELGKKIRSLHIKGGSAIYACCPNHSHGVADPHWWHSLDNWQKAAKVLESKLAEVDPANKDYYKQRSKDYRARLSGVKAWAKKELSVIPKANRQLATAHAAFGYFCKEYGFQSIPLNGLNSEQRVTPQYLAEAIGIVKAKQVKAIFPDESSNPKALQTAAKSAGVKLGGKLYADSHSSIEGMFAHNVRTIVAGLK